jgi:NADH-quinone oxidoreductase subunit L
MDPIISTALVILLLPLLSFVVLFFFGERLPRRGDWVGVGALGVCLLLALVIFGHFWGRHDPTYRIEQGWTWLSIDRLHIDAGILIDGMTAVMLVVVTLVSFLVHVFSTSYMHGDRRYSRYFAFLGWFTFSMLGIVLSNSLFFLYVFWELVGLASYLLIGFWFHKPSAAAANKKAFLTNRVGDFGFWLGILFFFTAVGSFRYLDLFTGVASGMLAGKTLTIAGVLLFMGCVGKSAQVPLHVWLPDAMEGPTPVSALIHAATMVAAGVYMTARLFPLFSPTALLVIAYVGAITAFFAATIALVATDIKKGLAYSTISQLGYMVMAVGVGGVVSGMFHLTTHAAFKALLFLGSGSVIHAVHTQEMPEMGGLRRKLPITFITFTLGTLAIAGVPPFAGFFSKDAILGDALAFAMEKPQHFLPFVLALLAAALTAFYMFRMVYLTFAGKPRDQHKYEHAHEGSWAITGPLIVLAMLSVCAGWGGWFGRFVAKPGPVVIDHAAHSMGAMGGMHGMSGMGGTSGMGGMHEMPASPSPAPALATDATSGAPTSAAPATGSEHAGHEGHTMMGEAAPAAGAATADAAEHAAHAAHIRHTAHRRAMLLSLLVAGTGILLSTLTYLRRSISSAGAQAALPRVYQLLNRKYYFDEFYGVVVGRGLFLWNAALAAFDKHVIDGLVNGAGYATRGISWLFGMYDRYFVDGLVNGTGELIRQFGSLARQAQTGRIQTYFLGVISGLVLLIILYKAVLMP